MRRFGIEYTFCFTGPDHKTRETIEKTVKELKIKGFTTAHADGSDAWEAGGLHLEVPSPIHRNYREAEKFYNKLKLAMRGRPFKERITRKDGDTEIWEGSGGGHVHIELPNFGPYHSNIRFIKRSKFKRRLGLFSLNRPYLTWVFGDPCDNAEAEPPSKGLDLSRSGVARMINQGLEAIGDRACDSRSHAIALRAKTIEFRMFDVPKSFMQVRDHVDFAQAVVHYCDKNGVFLNENALVLKSDYEEYWTETRVRVELARTCNLLGLEFKRYEKYLRNFVNRKELVGL